MEVKTIIGASAAYVCIKTDNINLDVRLMGGRSAFKSLRESADELLEKARRYQRDAFLMMEAADILEGQTYTI